MKKTLVFLALMLAAGSAFGTAQLELFLSESSIYNPGGVELTRGVVDYTAQAQTGSVTLSLWAHRLAGTTMSIAVDFDFLGDITNPSFTFNDIQYGIDPSYTSLVNDAGYSGPSWNLHSWDVTNNGAWDPVHGTYEENPTPPPAILFTVPPAYTLADAPVTGAELDNLRMMAVDGEGLKLSALYPGALYLLGTLTFNTGGGFTYIHMSTGASATSYMTGGTRYAATILYGDGELECSGDPQGNTAPYVLSDSWTEVGGQRVYNQDNADAFSTPEPASLLLMGLGALGVIRRRR